MPQSLRCISFDSYIKPQPVDAGSLGDKVVYLLIPTSNHNLYQSATSLSVLYIFWFLHQTTTRSPSRLPPPRCISFDSYIKPQLSLAMIFRPLRCISFDSYIKPQLLPKSVLRGIVVYLLIPTSNHNCTRARTSTSSLYIFWFLHQTTTVASSFQKGYLLYIFWFLHQTTTAWLKRFIKKGCISFDSYIKPQPLWAG